MKYFNENASVVYTDNDGRQIDTFVVFGTNKHTGLTHINHENLVVAADSLRLHEKTVGKYHLPIDDAFSFEILRKLKEKYSGQDTQLNTANVNTTVAEMLVLAKAS